MISTAAGGGYASSAGTSMATPHVSGAVALLLAQGLSPSAAVSRLLAGLDKVPCGAGCKGRLNVGTAVGGGPLPATPAAPTATGPALPTTTAVAPAGTAVPTEPATAEPAPTIGGAEPKPAESRPADVEPAGLAAGARRPLGAGGDLDPLVVGTALAMLLAAAGSVAGVWARRRLFVPASYRR